MTCKLRCFGFGANSRRNSVSAEDDPRAFRNFAQFFHEDRPGATQFVHYVPVMDDLLADINGSAVEVESDSDDINRANHTRAESARFQKNDLFHTTAYQIPPGRNSSILHET